MSEISDYIQLGVDTANRYVDLNAIFKGWPTQRTLVIRVCRPHPEVQAFIPDWLRLYADDKLEEGAVVEELFSLWLDTSGDIYQLRMDTSPIVRPTSQSFLDESLFWGIASRTETPYTAYITGKSIVIISEDKVDLRDLAHLSKLIDVIRDSLMSRGIDLVSLVREV